MSSPVGAPPSPVGGSRITRRPWLFALGVVAPFAAILTGVFVLDAALDRAHAWVPLEREPVFAYAPRGAHLAAQSHTGLAFTAACAPGSRCEYVRHFASPDPPDVLRARVERDLSELGFVRVEARGPRCPPALHGAERFARGEVSVWLHVGATPFAVGRTRTIGADAGAAVARLTIENMQRHWGC